MQSLCNRVDEGSRRLFAAWCVGVAVCSMVGCAAPSAAQSPVRRSNVPTPFVTLSPSTVSVAPGAKVLLTAKPGGGEAMMFSVDWRIEEGAAGGTVEAVGARQPDGTYQATYTAPADGAGPYHVIASLREYPAAAGTTTITPLPRR